MELADRLRAFLGGDDRDATDAIPYGWSVVELLRRRSSIADGRLRVRRWGRLVADVSLDGVGGFAQVTWRRRWFAEHPSSEMWVLATDGGPLGAIPWDRRTDAEARGAGYVVRRFAQPVSPELVRAVWASRPQRPTVWLSSRLLQTDASRSAR